MVKIEVDTASDDKSAVKRGIKRPRTNKKSSGSKKVKTEKVVKKEQVEDFSDRPEFATLAWWVYFELLRKAFLQGFSYEEKSLITPRPLGLF